MDNSELVDAVLAGVPGAGCAFFAAHDGFVRTTVRRASPAAAALVDDLAQEVYAHLWSDDFRVLRQWRRENPLTAYLRVVVRRLVWDRLHRLRPPREVVHDDPFAVAGAEAADPAPTPEENMATVDTREIVRDALGQLPDSHRQVLELRYFRDLSYHEIADMLGITVNNAGVRINRGLARLRAVVPPFIGSAGAGVGFLPLAPS